MRISDSSLQGRSARPAEPVLGQALLASVPQTSRRRPPGSIAVVEGLSFALWASMLLTGTTVIARLATGTQAQKLLEESKRSGPHLTSCRMHGQIGCSLCPEAFLECSVQLVSCMQPLDLMPDAATA